MSDGLKIILGVLGGFAAIVTVVFLFNSQTESVSARSTSGAVDTMRIRQGYEMKEVKDEIREFKEETRGEFKSVNNKLDQLLNK